MRVDVLTSAGSWQSEHPLLTYLVPSELQADVRVGQLVAVPYGERLVEGIVWGIQPDEDMNREQGTNGEGTINQGTMNRAPTGEEVLRPLHAILDAEPALLGHQIALAKWIAEYYVTPLAHVALMMLPPGLMQRSQVVLHLAKDEYADSPEARAASSLQLRALVGLLLCEGELDVERLKAMLGPKRAKEVLKEALASGLVEREPQLQRPKARVQRKLIVHLIAQGESLENWRQRMEARIQAIHSVPMAADNVRRRPSLKKSAQQRKSALPDPWALPTVVATLPLQDKEALIAQHQLAAVHLLEQSESQIGAVSRRYWTQGMLCKACALTRAQLQQLVREHIIAIEEVEIRRDPLLRRTIPASTPLSLTPDQQQALEQIVGEDALQQYHIRPLLLHGVTGSGKTEVYLQALAAVIAHGKRGILLVPEIALTTQAVQRVAGRFPGRVAIIHGRLSAGERYDEWRRIRAGQVDVIIGSRSALFSPVPDLGIIIVDEEHEPAYKQSERRPTYHARDVAIMLGYILHIPVVLGSATPAVGTFYSAEQGAYRLVQLPERIGAILPPVEVIDLRNELHSGNTSIISRRLHEELEHVLKLGQQAILFLNRRGAASCILCRDCGFVAMCDRCDIPLTYHATERMLLCHYCGSRKQIIQFCPNCNSSGIRYFGVGTEKVESTLRSAFPSARLLRWDKDTARNLRAHEDLLDRFANREADILVGTQMIAKGLDLPGVTLVGVISADIALNLP
ncbi:MAG: primosomal protein N', partial [Ktedonobacteraceae bacterium]|nr:primosomal protein N' [Ktedonobacteraceae bacterium]